MTTIDPHRPTLPAHAAPYDPRGFGLVAHGAGEQSEPGLGEMLGRLHLMMRGRYLISSILAILLAAGLGYAGYRLGEQTYRSVGQIRIVPTLPRIMYETEDKGVMPMFDSFVQTQVSLIKTQRVIEIALEDRGWPTPPPRDDASIAAFTKRLNVLRDNELIAITYDATDPVFAQMAVKTVIAAYKNLYIEADGKENENVLNQLTQRQAGLNNELASNRARIRAIAERYNTDQIDGIFQEQQESVRAMQLQLADLKQRQAQIEAVANSPEGATAEALAPNDITLQELIRQRTSARIDLKLKLATYAPEHEAVKASMRNLHVVEQSINDRVDEVKQSNGSGKGVAGGLLGQQINQLTTDLAAEQQKLKNTGQDRFQLVDLAREAGEINEKLNQTKGRIEELNTEAPVATGRVTVISEGDRPLIAAKDTRKTFAGAAGLLGFCLPFGLALLLSSANRKYGTPVETRMSSITRDLVLGALPAVDEDTFDAETSTIAAHCLHQVRTMLQIRCNGQAKSIAITSSRAGSGKTSVVLGLGVSYAMAGSKTLLIDLDLVGGGLTRRAEIQSRARLGNLLVGQGLVTDEQLQRALELAKTKQIKLGEAFVEAGHLRPEQLEAILNDQKRSHAGLMDALYGKPLQDCVSSAGMGNLDILPLGSANPQDAATLSPTEIKSVIDEAKTLYDTVLIDTGPVPGSLEASMVASMTDGVLLIVARGEPRSAAESSLEHLRRIGGRVVGLVFNRAKPSDAGMIGGSMYNGGTSLRVQADRQPSPAARHAASTRFGPVGQAVLDLSPSSMI